jgi:hypothetical protein
MFRLTTGRKPDDDEILILEAGLSKLRERYRIAVDDAVHLLKQGTKPTPDEINPSELAAWMLIANTILNLDETLVRN